MPAKKQKRSRHLPYSLALLVATALCFGYEIVDVVSQSEKNVTDVSSVSVFNYSWALLFVLGLVSMLVGIVGLGSVKRTSSWPQNGREWVYF